LDQGGPAVDLRRPDVDPIAREAAYQLKSSLGLNGYGPFHLGHEELELGIAHAATTAYGRENLGRLRRFFPPMAPVQRSIPRNTSYAGSNAERGRMRELLRARGLPVFNGEYPPDISAPPPLRSMEIWMPFSPGTRVLCDQGNNTMAMVEGHVASHAPSELRYALDFAPLDRAPGLPVTSVAPGRAYVYGGGRVNKADNWGYGNLVLVDHGNGYGSLYAHLDGFLVQSGDRVDARQPIGTVGATGLTGGHNHLHFQMVRMRREPNPSLEVHRIEGPPAPGPDTPFEGTFPFDLIAVDPSVQRLLPTKIPSSGFRSGEAIDLNTAAVYQAP
jgi:murein DD-endopeptidase MepM/ murein hydrolase activator NlpD